MSGAATVTLQDFLEALHPPGAGLTEFRALPSKAQDFFTATDAGAIRRFRDTHASENIYIGVATRMRPGDGSAANCGELYALFVDIDFKDIIEAEAWALIEKFPLKPSIVIKSGGGLHVYWLLKESLSFPADAARAKGLLRRLALTLRGDLSAAEVARILRVPGTLNHKYNPPRRVLIERFNAELAYNVSDFDDLLPEEPATNGNGQPRFELPEEIAEGDPGRDNMLYRFGRKLKYAGLTEAEIADALLAANTARCRPPLSKEHVREKAHHVATQPDRPEFAANGNGEAWQEITPTPEPLWPVLAEEALHGLAGEIVTAIDPCTEADKVAVLSQLLTMFGCVVGREPHFLVEYTRHPSKLFFALVGDTSKGRKGTSRSTLKRIFEAVDPAFTKNRMKGGLSSGEGLIWQVRDPMYDKKKDRKTGQEVEECVDEGEADKRLLIAEEEFAQALKVMAREGNILSPIIRQAFDDDPLTPLTKNNRITATESHIAIIGLITKAELLRHISETEMANGFCNRFIFLAVKRSKYLPNPKGLPMGQVERLAARLRDRIEQAQRAAKAGPLQRDGEAEALWAEVYSALSDAKPGLIGAILGRGECHVMRLALTYALLDGAARIQTPHLKAALALWEYAEASARFIFGDSTGDSVADRIVRALQTQGPMSDTDLSDLFGRHQKARRIHGALDLLERAGRIVSEVVETAGRTKTVWRVAK